MNKKISTLMAGGFLLTSVFASAQLVLNKPADVLKIADKVEAGKSYLVVQSKDDKLDPADRILSVVADDKGNLSYTAYQLGSFDGVQKETKDLEKANLMWTVGESKIGLGTQIPYYTLSNGEAGIYLSFTVNKRLILTVEDSKKALNGVDGDKTKDVYSYFITGLTPATAGTIAQGGYLYSENGTYQAHQLQFESGGVTLDDQNDDAKLYFCVYQEAEADIADLNDVMGGEGFALEFDGDDEYENNILKDLNLKAFEVASSITMGAGSIPEGIYLATDYPESLIGTNEIKTKADFEACTFIAVDPDVNYDIHKADRENGIGFEFKTVKGDAFNYYKGTDKKELSEKGEVYIGNANFSIVIPNPLTEPESYQLKLADIRVLAKATDTQHTNKGPVYLGTIKDQNKNYLLTDNEGVALSTTNSTLYYPTGLLNATDAPAIYTIKFVSGEDKEGTSEYGLNLTVMQQGSKFQPVAVAQADGNDPLYQFVIANVDTDNRTFTFHNRQTKAKITLSLYHAENDPENVYTVFQVTPAKGFMDNNVYVEEADGQSNQKLKYTNTVALHKTKVELTKVDNESIDKFASFMNREEGAGVVKFRLARTEEAEAVFYAGADRTKKGDIKDGTIQAWEDYADNFELIKSKDSTLVLSKDNYVYLFKDDADNTKDVWRKSVEKDTVAYYTYKIKLFDDDKNYYVKADSKNGYPALVEGENFATEFIIKANVDGSYSLIRAISSSNVLDKTLIESDAQYAWVLADDDNKDAWQMSNYYTRPNASLRTYIEEESGAISLEPVAQHVSFEASEGGFVSAKDGEGKIAIANEVTDELKFWVEPQDDQVNIPSFYIANAGRYMYYAEDSSKYAVQNKDKYVFGSKNDVKLIFKAGELIDANTLQTTVDNKLVNVVAENANPAKNEKAGLKNFLYQIIKFAEGSDEYVIRCTENNWYVRNINGQLTLTQKREDALLVTVTKEAAPTANDEIFASEVKVIAGNGQITINGAAGKKVVVSNILGQVVANTVITSDNATIAAPQGIVVVAVEGEEAVKAIVK